VAWHSIGHGMILDHLLPFHLCDVAAITAGLALLTRRYALGLMTYFWGLAATAQALVTPAIDVGVLEWPHVTFFIQHFAIVAASLYLPLIQGWRPKAPFWRAPLEAYVCSLGYMGLAFGVNVCLGTNFGFVTHKPPNPSLIDHLGVWPWYLCSMQAVALVLFFVLVTPFFAKKRSRV
jgi:hypothetical integral membrane protein (TIGR02206 family)